MKLNGQRLRDARKAAGLSRPELYLASGVSAETIKRAEENANSTSAENIAALAVALGVSMDSLFDQKPEATPA